MTAISDLEQLDREALARLWTDLFGGAVPTRLSQVIQRRFLAFELQAKAQGRLPTALSMRLQKIAAGDRQRPAPALQTGARLLREWNGTTHVVDAIGDVFRWQGKDYRSLSAIARAITGARWSGPRFFGLTNPDVVSETSRQKRRGSRTPSKSSAQSVAGHR